MAFRTMLEAEPQPTIIPDQQKGINMDAPCESASTSNQDAKGPPLRSVRFDADVNIHHVETRTELEPFGLWHSREEHSAFRQSAKQTAMDVREHDQEAVQELENCYRISRDMVRQLPYDGLASRSQRLVNWSMSAGRGLERYSPSRDAKDLRSNENRASRNLVLNVQHLLKKKENYTEMIAQHYATFALHANFLAQMMALADAEVAAVYQNEAVVLVLPTTATAKVTNKGGCSSGKSAASAMHRPAFGVAPKQQAATIVRTR